MTQSRFRQAESMSATSAQHLHGQRQQTTDGAGAARQRLRRTAASVLAFLAFCLLMISLQPFDFASEFDSGDTEGDRINQIGFLIAGVAMTLGLVTLVDRRLLHIFFAPGWIAILIVLTIAVYASPDPSAASRTAALTLIGMILAAGVVLLPPDERAFQRVSAAAVLTVIVLAYLGILLWPEKAVHGSDMLHVGRWRGHFNHKNIASPVMSVFVMFGIYLWRSKMPVIGAIIFCLALLFVAQAGAKSTNGLLPLPILAVLAGRLLGLPLLTVGLYAICVAAVGALTLGSVYFEPLSRATASILSDPSFTGRVTLWEYGLDNIGRNLLFGNGYDGFWGTSVVEDSEAPFDSPWDFRGISNGHSNYIDMILVAGVVGAAILFWVVFVAPAVNYVKSCSVPANRNLADLFMMIVIFMAMLSFLETFLIGRVHQVWLCLVIAMTGLQLTSRYRIV